MLRERHKCHGFMICSKRKRSLLQPGHFRRDVVRTFKSRARFEGLHWSDTFAGFGSRDQIQCQIVTGLEQRLKRRLDIPPTHCTTEKCWRRFKLLQGMHPRWKSQHAERDVLERLGGAKQQVIDLLPKRTASFHEKRAANLTACKFVDTLYARAPLKMSYVQCCNHMQTKRRASFDCSFLCKAMQI